MTTQLPDITLAEPAPPTLITRAGVTLMLRPVHEGDETLLSEFFAAVAPEDLRFRFLTPRNRMAAEDLARLVAVDHRHSEHLLAFDKASGAMAASLMIVGDAEMQHAEVAITVAKAFKYKGLGWTLLHHATELAKARGFAKLRSVESRDNYEALEVERMSGFRAVDFEEPGQVTVEVDLTKWADLAH